MLALARQSDAASADIVTKRLLGDTASAGLSFGETAASVLHVRDHGPLRHVCVRWLIFVCHAPSA